MVGQTKYSKTVVSSSIKEPELFSLADKVTETIRAENAVYSDDTTIVLRSAEQNDKQ